MRAEKKHSQSEKDFKITQKRHCRILNSIGESKGFNMYKEKNLYYEEEFERKCIKI